MSDIVIQAEKLGKKYLIGHEAQSERYTALRDIIARNAKGIARSARAMLDGRQLIQGDSIEEFWALRNVNFEIKRGDVVGIIGRNGAGKSTLLKVLSRITEPSAGRVEIRGRVVSLLEVGTGFHPELSGRENIYLNGAILGMARAEIKAKFDEIIAFAEIEKFLDTPVKRYSSGMYVRLAFAVAAHLESEILIVDEVLAVGDAAFQKKCLGKMSEVAGNGRTVLFVSHNMGAIAKLCRSGIHMKLGTSTFFENVDDALACYNSSMQSEYKFNGADVNEGFEPQEFRLVQNKAIAIAGVYHSIPRNLIIAVRVINSGGDEVFWTTSADDPLSPPLSERNAAFTFELPNYLQVGDYLAELVTFVHNDRFLLEPGKGPRINFSILQPPDGSSFFQERRPGVVRPLIEWRRDENS